MTVRISRNSLQFATTDGREVTFERYAMNSSISLAANLREALRQMPLLQVRYGRVTVMVDSPVLMIPTDLFHEEVKEMLYRYTFTNLEQQSVVHSVVPDLNAVAVFSIEKDVRQVLTDRYDTVILHPATMPVWRHLYQKSFTGSRAKLYGYFHDRRLEVCSFGLNRFKFYNSYAVSVPDDALYYLLAVWKQLGMVPHEDELHLSGDIPEKNNLQEKAQQFVKRVFVCNPTGEFNRAPVTQIEGMPYDLMLHYLKR